MITEGIYETLLTASFKNKLAKLPVERFYIAQESIDKAEASKLLSIYLINLVQMAMREIGKDEEGLQKQIFFCNDVINFIDKKLQLDISESLVALEGQFSLQYFLK